MKHKQAIGRVVRDRREFISRLKIANEKGVVQRFDTPHPEQVELLRALENPLIKTVVVDKPRQIGGTTLNCADTFYSTYVARDPIRTLVTAHENDATDSIFSRIRFFHDTLPQRLRRELARSNRKELVYKDTNAGIRCMTAGGRGQGRSWTYQRLVAEELAFWPNARDVWASLTSTMHEGPHSKTVLISTRRFWQLNELPSPATHPSSFSSSDGRTTTSTRQYPLTTGSPPRRNTTWPKSMVSPRPSCTGGTRRYTE